MYNKLYFRYLLAQLKLNSKRFLLQNCFLCGASSNQLLCTACLFDLPYQTMVCSHCSKPLDSSKYTENICRQCQQNPPSYNNIQVVFSYIYPIDKLISAAKFANNLAILHLLGKLMVEYLQFEPCPDVMIPIPLHPKRLQQRGYNQSVELAKCIKSFTGIPLDYNVCQRIRNTRPQVGLSAQQRKANIQGAFKVNKISANWQHIVLIDDVVTTGNTVEELTKEFLQAGIQKVDVWYCAHR
ncbi:MAG TPA: ComF family protein [Thioploca sp.]|nr:ComF family protein [Thioploca sp.]